VIEVENIFYNDFDNFCDINGIIHKRTVPYTPQQNSLVERKNRTLMDMVNAMLNHSGLSVNLWGEAIFSAIHILNRVPSKRFHFSPMSYGLNVNPT
jgi:hypothetical protein